MGPRYHGEHFRGLLLRGRKPGRRRHCYLCGCQPEDLGALANGPQEERPASMSRQADLLAKRLWTVAFHQASFGMSLRQAHAAATADDVMKKAATQAAVCTGIQRDVPETSQRRI